MSFLKKLFVKDKPAITMEPLQSTQTENFIYFDSKREDELLEKLDATKSDAFERHFVLTELQDFYYKYRDLDDKYLDECIQYCFMDIEYLPALNKAYVKRQHKQIDTLASVTEKTTGKTCDEQKAEVTCFPGRIPAYKRLAIIYEKSKNYDDAIHICNLAVIYYNSIGLVEQIEEFEKRRDKIAKKL